MNFQVGNFDPEQIAYLYSSLAAIQAKLQLKDKKKKTNKDTLLHIFETVLSKEGINLYNGKNIHYSIDFIQDLRDNLKAAIGGQQIADQNLQNVFGKAFSDFRFVNDIKERFVYYESLIKKLEVEQSE